MNRESIKEKQFTSLDYKLVNSSIFCGLLYSKIKSAIACQLKFLVLKVKTSLKTVDKARSGVGNVQSSTSHQQKGAPA